MLYYMLSNGRNWIFFLPSPIIAAQKKLNFGKVTLLFKVLDLEQEVLAFNPSSTMEADWMTMENWICFSV